MIGLIVFTIVFEFAFHGLEHKAHGTIYEKVRAATAVFNEHARILSLAYTCFGGR